jgi:hypothetical protein
MALIALAGMTLFLAASFVVGGRLVLLWTRTRQLPELLIGLSFLLAGGFGATASTVGGELLGRSPALAARLGLTGNLLVDAGVVFLVFFVGRVFRPGRAGTAACCIAAAALAGVGVLNSVHPASGATALARTVLRILVYAWATAESGLEWRAARRRQRLGLTEAAVVNRYLLWSVGTGAIVLLWVHGFWRSWEAAAATTGAASGYLVIATLGMLCAAAMWLAFFPPEAWLRRFATSAPAA